MTPIECIKIVQLYRNKGSCVYDQILTNCDKCPIYDIKRICTKIYAYKKSKIIIENNPELFMEYLL